MTSGIINEIEGYVWVIEWGKGWEAINRILTATEFNNCLTQRGRVCLLWMEYVGSYGDGRQLTRRTARYCQLWRPCRVWKQQPIYTTFCSNSPTGSGGTWTTTVLAFLWYIWKCVGAAVLPSDLLLEEEEDTLLLAASQQFEKRCGPLQASQLFTREEEEEDTLLLAASQQFEKRCSPLNDKWTHSVSSTCTSSC